MNKRTKHGCIDNIQTEKFTAKYSGTAILTMAYDKNFIIVTIPLQPSIS
jgi:hypothetical protein